MNCNYSDYELIIIILTIYYIIIMIIIMNSFHCCTYLPDIVDEHVTIVIARGNLVTRMSPPQTV